MNEQADTPSSTRTRRVDRLLEGGAIAVLRTDDPASIPPLAEALVEGGISAVEVTMTVPDALSAVEAVAERVGEDGIVGVGSVLGAKTVLGAVQAGAEFVVSPVFKREIVDAAHQHDVPAVPGALTPTEIQAAHEAGADFVKVFPASTVGREYLGAVKAPLPHLRLCPTGGVSLDGAGDWFRAGASMVAVGSALLDGVSPDEEDYAPATENARRLRRSIDAARENAQLRSS